jgi:mannan endo-1,4-beta-mannosidase
MMIRMGNAACKTAIASVMALGISASAWTQSAHNDEFVQRDGTRLTLGGETFRYSGPNIEWLGIEAYGPADPMGPRYPSRLEVDDALDTAKDMGARVVRSQTLGDSVECNLCIEPAEGVFNPEAFKSIDYALKAAHDRGLRLIITLAGDCANCEMSGPGQYLLWKGQSDFKKFFSDPAIIGEFEDHIRALLNHKNSLTGIAYKDDPTILAWENCNVCSIGLAWSAHGQSLAPYLPWIDTIGSFIKSIDKKHLYMDNSGFFLFDKNALDARTPDIVTSEYYPHWDALMGTGYKTTKDTFSQHAEMVTAKGKVYVACEFGWDVTDWPTRDDFAAVLKALETDPKISGDDYWALQAHADKFGWQPIPAPVSNAAYARTGESGQWWSLFYGGVNTLVNTREDMQARAEMLRAHAYAMEGVPVPPHAIPAPPKITFVGLGLLGWHGSAGAVKYSVQRRNLNSAEWVTICDKCATDADTPWVDPKPGVPFATKYRVMAWNADGKASEPSAER